MRFISRLAKSLFVRKPSLSYGIRVLLIYLIKHAEEKSESVVYLLSRGRRPFDRLAVSLELKLRKLDKNQKAHLNSNGKVLQAEEASACKGAHFYLHEQGRILKAFFVPPSRLPPLRKAGLDL